MMEIEDESILKIIFKGSYSDSWRDNPDVSHYLRQLGSYNLEKIHKEPEIIQEEKDVLLEQTQELAFRNYKTFIQTAECSKEIFRDFSTVEKNLNELSHELPNFIDKCQQFCKKSQEINGKRRLTTLTLAKHPQLLEILEMPQLMDTCVRNNYYDEALELAAYVCRLEKKYPLIPIIQAMAREIQDSMKLMLSQLIRQLRSNTLLPECLKVIGYLRRMSVFSEEELRMKFLHARDSWFQNIVNVIPFTDPYQHITKVIEASRVHLFDIITQYRAIFADDDPILIGSKDTQFSYSAILHGWVTIKISQFLNILENDLSKDIGNRIDSVLGQCMYFGLSFSRVGADFRGLLVPLFEECVLKSFKNKMIETHNKFNLSMQSYVLISPPTMLVSSVLASTTAAQDKLHPPLSILEFSPLVELCNNILTAFNDLRLLAPVSIAGDIAELLQQCLLSNSKILLDYYKAEENSMSDREKEIFTKFCIQYASVFLPYVDLCLQAVYPQQQIAQMVGLSSVELAKLGGLGKLKCDEIAGPISFILPPQETEIMQSEEILKKALLTSANDDVRLKEAETRIIPVETKTVTPVFETLIAPVESVEISAELVASPVEPVAISVEPVAIPVEPVAIPVEPVAISVEPVAISVEPVAISVEPVAISVEPIENSVEPVAISVEPVAISVEPIENSVEPVAIPEEAVAVSIVTQENIVNNVTVVGLNAEDANLTVAEENISVVEQNVSVENKTENTGKLSHSSENISTKLLAASKEIVLEENLSVQES